MSENKTVTGTPLTSFELNVLSWIEQIWYKTGSLPSTDMICLEFDLTKRRLSQHTRKNQWKAAWQARGLPDRSTQSLDQQTLTPKQLMVANILLNEHDRSSLKRKLEMAGLTTSQFQAWMADPTFVNYMRRETDRRFGTTDIFAHQSLKRLVIDGDLNAIKYFFDITGRHTTQADALNFNSILAKLMEILSRYLTPGVLQQVADDLEEALGQPAIQLEPPRPSLYVVDAEIIPEEPEEINSKGKEGAVELVESRQPRNQSRDEIATMAFSLHSVNKKKGKA